MKRSNVRTVLVAVAIALFGGWSGIAWAHCDTESGPVAVDARKALETGKFVPVAIWVGEDQNDELHSAFVQCLPVYQMGGKAKALAERHFMDTAVRLHRQAEGLPYTGLKPAQPLPADIATAERALDTGDLQPVSNLLQTELEKKLTMVFDEARKARSNKDKNLTAGREWADAYVKYVIYVHGLYKTIQAGPKHGVGE
ncbi:MAG: DUF6448 family protein [Desulfuromusa sp.]|jgi:hypothetical protein|nr:DUF6448 family protein [Desulfuromusa sp.]